MKKPAKFQSPILKTMIGLSLALLLVLSLTVTALAQGKGSVRQGGVDVFFLVQQMLGDKTRASDTALDLEIDNTFVFGAGVGINLTDYLNLNLDTWLGRTDIHARDTGFTSKTSSDLLGVDINLDYHLFRSELSPFVTGGIGIIKFSGSMAGLDFGETEFSYNLGGGLRWDISKKVFLKGLYRFTWTELENTADKLLLDGFSFSVGYIFR